MNPVQAKLAPIVALVEQRKLEQAKVQCLRVLQSHGADAGVNAMMAHILVRLGRPDQALFYAERAVGMMPNEPDLLMPLGEILIMLDRAPDAVGVLTRAIGIDPSRAGAAVALAAAYAAQGRFCDARDVCMGAVDRGVVDANLSASLAHALLNTGRADDGVAVLERAMERWPENPVLAGNRANMMNYAAAGTVLGADPAAIFAAHVEYGTVMRRLSPAAARQALKWDGQRPLRIGIISPDLRRHSVACFIEPLLACRDAERFEIFAYATNLREDSVSERLKGCVTRWSNVAAMTEPEIVTRIRNDRIDVLIELSGLTVGHALGVMQGRAAPVQVTYLGYPNTTGLDAIDARVVDSVTDPEAEGGERMTERPARLDGCFLCFQPPRDAPEVQPGGDGGGTREGGVVFGSFNAAQKLNAPLLALWSRVLGAVPGSRLVLKATNFADSRLIEEVSARFAAAGVDAGRVTLLPPQANTTDHLSAYHEIDIGLDPSPYNGTTTTCEAMFMGVPVVSLCGRVHASRVGASLLTAVGVPELIAESEAEYVACAAALASDSERRAWLRRTLRERMRTSPLCDGPGFARRFGELLKMLALDAAAGARREP